MNVQLGLIWEFILHEFKLGYNALDATKNICSVKGKDTVHYSMVTRLLKKFCMGYKYFEGQARSDKQKHLELTNCASRYKNIAKF